MYKFYSSELVYNQPKSQGPTECYYPVCKYTLDYDKLYDWLCDQPGSYLFYEEVLDSVFNKDKPKVKELLKSVQTTQVFDLSYSSSFSQLGDCSWWSLPKSTVQHLLQYTGKDTWTLEVYKNYDGTWGFDLPELLTKNEKFVNGTQHVLDLWYLQLNGTQGHYDVDGTPLFGEKLLVTLSSKYFPNSTTQLVYWQDDDKSSYPGQTSIEKPSYYFDTQLGEKLWLCQYLQFLFHEKPPTLWVNVSNCCN